MSTAWLPRVRACRSYPDEFPDPSEEETDPLSTPPGSDDPWEAFEADDDYDPQPEPGDFWFEEE